MAPTDWAQATAPLHGTDIVKVQVWRGHANVATTWRHDQRHPRIEDRPTFRGEY